VARALLRREQANLTETRMSEKPAVPGTPGRRNPTDAIEPSGDVNKEKLKKNQERLHVGGDHKTDGMKKGHRGTFP
jgi:hypothetical protein